MTPKRDWFVIAEVAEQLSVPLQTVYYWVHNRRVEAHRAGKTSTYLIHQSEIDRLRKTGNRPVDRRYNRSTRIDATKRYRIKSTGEVITGAELLRRRNNPQ